MKKRGTARKLITSLLAASVLGGVLSPAVACTSMVFKAKDGTGIYARTMEWGASDLKSEMVLVPRAMPFASALGDGKTGMAWKNAYGFVGINAGGLPYATDGMNEAGLTVGALFFPGFAEFQESSADQQSVTISSVDIVNYLLSNFKTVEEVRKAMPKIRVVRNADIEKEFGTPVPLHHVATDATGASIVIEYTAAGLTIFDNKVGVMTNSPAYDWHLLNLRNYANLKPSGAAPDRSIDGVSLAPFGAGSGMLGIARRFHAAVAIHPRRRLCKYHGAGQGCSRSCRRGGHDAEQLRYPEGPGARRRQPGRLSPRLHAMVGHRRHQSQGLLLLDHVRPADAQR